MKVGCHVDEQLGLWVCTHEAIVAAVHGLTNAAFDIKDLRIDLEQARAENEQLRDLADVNQGEIAGELWDMTQDRDRMASQRWTFLWVGVGAGAVLTAVVCVLVGGL
jgi:hypothetical protein